MTFWRFNDEGASLGAALQGSYDPLLVGLSVVIACFAGITALALADRMTASPSRAARIGWQIAGAIALGLGIWTMHFTGMLAFRLAGHPEMQYDAGLTALSLIPAIIGSLATLHLVAQARIRHLHLQLCALALAGGVGTMHYTGMEAMNMPGLRYDATLFAASNVMTYLLAMIVLRIPV